MSSRVVMICVRIELCRLVVMCAYIIIHVCRMCAYRIMYVCVRIELCVCVIIHV